MARLVPCALPKGGIRLRRARGPDREGIGFEHPRIDLGSTRAYRYWTARAREYLRESGRDPAALDRTDATINYAQNRMILFHLADPRNELSVAETVSHEVIHALLEQLGERGAARALDSVARSVGRVDRAGGV